MLGWLVDLILHLDRHLVELLARYDLWIYPILFAVIFAETGLVVTPFLPGDSLLFAVGALAAVDTSGTLRAPLASVLLGIAAVLGNTVNYSIGRAVGPRAFSGRYRWLKVEHLHRTEEFFRRHGGLAILLSRFVPLRMKRRDQMGGSPPPPRKERSMRRLRNSSCLASVDSVSVGIA